MLKFSSFIQTDWEVYSLMFAENWMEIPTRARRIVKLE